MARSKILLLSVLAHGTNAWLGLPSLSSAPAMSPDVLSRTSTDQTFVLQLETPVWNSGGSDSSIAPQYLGCNGYGTENQNLASLWTIINGQLISLTEGGYVSCSEAGSGSSSPFSPFSRVQALSSGFTISSEGRLSWDNPAFSNGSAAFCQQRSDGSVITYSGVAPDNCVDTSLRVASPSSVVSPPVVSPSPAATLATATRLIPTPTNAGPKCQVQTGISPPLFSPNLENPSAKDVENASIAWLNDVCTVDSFLNHPIDGPTTLETTIAFAIDEPIQLTTLSSIPNLSIAGKSAAAALEANFPGIPANLYNVQNDTATPLLATSAINLVRCCVVLRSIGVLIQEASKATGAFSNTTIPQPVYPSPCASIDCSFGASPGTEGTGWFTES